MMALLWSWRAPATISEADALPWFIKTTRGNPFIKSFFTALYLLPRFPFLPFVETISPLSKNMSVTLTAWSSNPPGLFLKSST